jgi:RAT1-interacting protein
MNAVKLNNTMYLPLKYANMCSYIEEDMNFESRRASNREHALAMFSGYKFETLSTLPASWDSTPRPQIESRNTLVVDNIQQYCSIVKTQLGSTSIVMGGEVDCVWGIPQHDELM